MADQLELLKINTIDILSYLDSLEGTCEHVDTFNSWLSKLNYTIDRIHLKRAVVSTLLKYNKYYLD